MSRSSSSSARAAARRAAACTTRSTTRTATTTTGTRTRSSSASPESEFGTHARPHPAPREGAAAPASAVLVGVPRRLHPGLPPPRGDARSARPLPPLRSGGRRRRVVARAHLGGGAHQPVPHPCQRREHLELRHRARAADRLPAHVRGVGGDRADLRRRGARLPLVLSQRRRLGGHLRMAGARPPHLRRAGAEGPGAVGDPHRADQPHPEGQLGRAPRRVRGRRGARRPHPGRRAPPADRAVLALRPAGPAGPGDRRGAGLARGPLARRPRRRNPLRMSRRFHLCVFCGARDGNTPLYAQAATALGRRIGERGLGLVYGGARVGLMGALADAALSAGAQVLGVLPRSLSSVEVAHAGLTELVLVDGLHARKARMTAESDAFAALPGGFGTLDELFEALTWAQRGLHTRPLGLLNVDGFWDPLVATIDRQVAQGFVTPSDRERLTVESTPDALLDALGAPGGA